MFKKELFNVLKQTIIFLAFLAALPAVILVLRIAPRQPYSALLMPAVQAGLLFWSFFLGASLFGRERGQRALEYMASLPYSRLGLLERMAAPRILVLTGLWALTLLIPAGWFQNHAFLPPELFGAAYFLVFVVALSIAPLFENFLVLAFSTLLAFFLVGLMPFAAVCLAFYSRGFPAERSFLPAWRDILSLSSSAFPIGALPFLPLLAFPFVVALIAAFPKFDIRPSPAFRRRFALVLMPALALSGLIAFAAINRRVSAWDYQNHYLTQDLHLIDFGYLSNRLTIRDGQTVRRIKLGSAGFWDPYEDGGFLYFLDIEGAFKRLDISSGAAETLIGSGRSSATLGVFWAYGASFVFFESGARPNEVQLVRIEMPAKSVTRTTYSHESFAKGMKMLIGTNVFGGRRFWLSLNWSHGRGHLLRLWDDGRAEEISLPETETASPGRLAYYDGLLLNIQKDALIVLKDTGTSFEILKKFPSGEVFIPAFNPWSFTRFDRPTRGFLVGKRGQKIARLDLSSLTIEDIGAWTEEKTDRWGYIVRLDDWRFYLQTGSRDLRTTEIYDLNEGRMRLIWSSPPALPETPAMEVSIFRSGILTHVRNEFRAYAFPDMREIKY